MFLEPQDQIIGLSMSAGKAIAVSDLIPIAQLLTTDCEELKLFFSTGFDCHVKQMGKDLQKGKIRLSVEFIPETTTPTTQSLNIYQTPKAKGDHCQTLINSHKGSKVLLLLSPITQARIPRLK